MKVIKKNKQKKQKKTTHFKPHPERRAIAKHFCYSNTLPLLIKLEKLIQISAFTFVQVRII